MAEDLSPSDIRARKFTTVRRGFDRAEVADFLTRVSDRVSQLERELGSVTSRLDQLGITDLVDLKEEIEDVGLEIQAILDAAMAAAEGLRARAADAAEDKLAEADRAAYALREDAWNSGTELLEDAQTRADRLLAEAREDALFIRAQAEQDAKRLVTQARREADDLLRSSREEGERIVVMAKAESDSILDEANRAAAKAQERARALENRRAELLSELQEAELAARDVEAARTEPSPESPGGVRVIATDGDERTHWPEDEGAVRILPAAPPEPAEQEPIDAEAMAAEVAMMRGGATLPQSEGVVEEIETAEAPAPEPEAPAEDSVETGTIADTDEVRVDAVEGAEPESEVVPGEEPVVESPAEERESPAETVEETTSAQLEPTVEDKVTVVADDPAIDDLFAKLRRSVEEPSAVAEPEPPAAGQQAEPESGAASRPESVQPPAPPVLHVVPNIVPTADFDRRDRTLLPIENRGLRGLKRRIVELQNRVLEEMRRAPGGWKLGREHVAHLMGEELDAVLVDSFEAGHATAAEVLGKPEPQLLGGPQQGAAETFTFDLHRDVQAVIEKGEPGTRRMAADVSRVFRNWRTDEAERHVRMAARRAFNDGLLAGFKRMGVAEVEVVESGRPCGKCGAGTGLRWNPAEAPPTGAAVPPAAANCDGLISPISSTGSDTRREQ